MKRLGENAKHEIVYVPIGSRDDVILEAGNNAEVIVVDAMGVVTENVINHMPFLKLIHSEGVGYQGVAVEAARRRNMCVYNCKSMNAKAVAEHTIMLMLSVLRFMVTEDQAVRTGEQILTKENHMVSGDLRELSECTIGFIGFGDIAKETNSFLMQDGINEGLKFDGQDIRNIVFLTEIDFWLDLIYNFSKEPYADISFCKCIMINKGLEGRSERK